jgi:O-methyltransferase
MIQWFVDSISTSAVRGWAFDSDQTEIGIKVLHDGRIVSRNVHWLDRPDVIRVDSRARLTCGFQIDLDVKSTSMLSELALIFEPSGQRNNFLVPSVKYDRYLSEVWAHCQFVTRNFPTLNPTARSDRDANPAQNSPHEMLSIANHLYKLKEAGVEGAFAEFGCFKGFSSAMLSVACKLLGIRMHIFDSFEGLPSSTGVYLSGEFKGSLEEVKENIRTFGAVDVVEFHKGYFNEVLPETKIPHLMSIWLDVDLESSSADVMSIFRILDPRGAVFSHECCSANFVDGKIVAARHPDSVIPPIIDAFRSAGAEANGMFLCGNTGSFWRKDNGIAVARCDNVISLANRHSIAL